MATKSCTFYRCRGFSLIEMLVYIGMLVFMLAIIMEVVTSMSRSERAIQSLRTIENSAVSAMERIGREARQAESINATSSIFNIHPGRVVFNSTTASGTPRTVEFYFANGTLWLKENGVDTGAITESNANTTSVVFRRFATSTVEGVRIELTIESGTSTHYRSETFYSSALLRQ